MSAWTGEAALKFLMEFRSGKTFAGPTRITKALIWVLETNLLLHTAFFTQLFSPLRDLMGRVVVV